MTNRATNLRNRLATLAALTLACTASVTATHETDASASVRHTCHGHRATISGNAKSNNIAGTRHRDVIWAGPGNDHILGGGGRDLICGGPGRDMLDGNGGNDTIYGGAGADWCVAPRAAEHRLHHQCEIHVGLPAGQQPPGATPARATRTATKAPAATPPATVDRRLLTDCGAAATCNAGVVVCNSSMFAYFGDPRAAMPTAYTRDGGMLAITVSLYTLRTDGTFQLKHDMPWKSYRVGSGTWELPPDQVNVRLSGEPGGVGYLVDFFSYSGDDGATWSTPQATVETSYVFKTYSGWGTTFGDGNIVAGACNL